MSSIQSVSVQTIDFHGAKLATFEADGEKWVAMRPVVEGMGLDWSPQRKKLNGDTTLQLRSYGLDSGRGEREMLCIPLRRYPMWLASVNPARIPNPEVRARVILFREMSVEALYQFWTTGASTFDSVRDAMSSEERQNELATVLKAVAQYEARLHKTVTNEASSIIGAITKALRNRIETLLIQIQERQDHKERWDLQRAKASCERDTRTIRGIEGLASEVRALIGIAEPAIRRTDRVTMQQALAIVGVPEAHRTAPLSRHLTARSASGWFAERGGYFPAGKKWNRLAAEFASALVGDWWKADGHAEYQAFLAKIPRKPDLRVVHDLFAGSSKSEHGPAGLITIREAQDLLGLPLEVRSASLSGALSHSAQLYFEAHGHASEKVTRVSDLTGENAEYWGFDQTYVPAWWEARGRAAYDSFFAKQVNKDLSSKSK